MQHGSSERRKPNNGVKIRAMREAHHKYWAEHYPAGAAEAEARKRELDTTPIAGGCWLPREGLDPGRGRLNWGRGSSTVRSSYPAPKGWSYGTLVPGWARNSVRQG